MADSEIEVAGGLVWRILQKLKGQETRAVNSEIEGAGETCGRFRG